MLIADTNAEHALRERAIELGWPTGSVSAVEAMRRETGASVEAGLSEEARAAAAAFAEARALRFTGR